VGAAVGQSDKSFLMGSAPTEIDAITYGQLANIMSVRSIECPVQHAALKHANLVAYVARVPGRLFT
jgi:hypothetical protein